MNEEAKYIEIITDTLAGSKMGDIIRILKREHGYLYYMGDRGFYGIPKVWEGDVFKYVDDNKVN